jgi:hypothetical protein
MTARGLVSALKGHWHGNYGMCCCPAHQDRTPSLKVEDGETTTLFYCFAGCPTGDVIDALKARGLWGQNLDRGRIDHGGHHGVGDRDARDLDNDQRTKLAKGLWKKATPADGTAAETYLRGRGITCSIPPTIRYLAAAKHSGTGLWLPCMIAGVAIWPSREISGIHRTYLSIDGRKKSPISNNKMMLGPCRGGAVRLAPEGPTLILAEGIETGLSVLQSTGRPVWACLSTSGLKSVVLPNTVNEVVIAADGDDPGNAAAAEAASRFIREGRKVRIAYPPAGMDFNDVLNLPENVTPFPMEKRNV